MKINFKNFSKRKLISSGEKEVSFLQLFGCFLILMGIVSIIISGIIKLPSGISISFLITMLGFAFVFPSLLEGNEGLSTMRIVVFMMTNVICMLLLKIGWAESITSLKQIGLNQWWMGVIAFVFGAKATQSYFESKMAVAQVVRDKLDNSREINVYSKDIVEKAIEVINSRKDDRILGIGYLPKEEYGTIKYYVHLNVTNDATKTEYANTFQINIAGKNISPPFIIEVTESPTTHSNSLPGAGIHNITGVNGNGTFGCVVLNNQNKKCILSCQHVLKDDTNYDTGVGKRSEIILTDGSSDTFANHISGKRSNLVDGGLAILNDQNINNNNLGITKGERDTTDYDVVTNKKISLKGFDPDNKRTINMNGVIINNGFEVAIDYKDGKNSFKIQNTIVLSQATDNFKTISKGGYSGAIVLDNDGYVIGMVIGGDEKFTYAVPINTLKKELTFKFKS